MARKIRFGISLKLSLTITLILLFSFTLFFSFFYQDQTQTLREKMLDSLTLKLENLKQDVGIYAFELENGEIRSQDLQKKLTALYEGGYEKESDLAQIQEAVLLNRRGQILAHQNPSLRLKSYLGLEKRRAGLEEYQVFQKDWEAYQDEVHFDPVSSVIQRNGKPLTQILIPVYLENPKVRGGNQLQRFQSLYRDFQNRRLFQGLPQDSFFLETFSLFHLFYEKRDYLDDQGRLTEKAKNLLVRLKENRKKAKGNAPQVFQNDFENIFKALSGFYYFSEQYWYQRVKEGQDILNAIGILNTLRKNQSLEKQSEKVREILENYAKNPNSQWNASLVLALVQLKKIYEKNISPFERLIPESSRQLSVFFSETLAIQENLEALQEQPEKQQSYALAEEKKLEERITRIGQWLLTFEKLLRNYSEVTLSEENKVFNQRFLIQALKGVFRIQAAELWLSLGAEKWEVMKASQENQEQIWIQKIESHQVLYRPISLEEKKEGGLSLKDQNSLYSFYFIFALHQMLDAFFLPGGELNPDFQELFQNPVPDSLRSFQEKDLDQLQKEVRWMSSALILLNQKETARLPRQKNLILEGERFSFDSQVLNRVFQKIFQRYDAGTLLVRVSEEKAQIAVQKKTNYLIDLTLNLLIRFLLISVLFSLFFLKKFHLLFQGVQIVGDGNLNHRIQIQGSDEFGQLSDYFNGMTKNLRQAQVQIREKSRMEEELKIAERIQVSLLPKEYPEFPDLAFDSFYQAQTETGGDYLDFIPLDEKNLGLVIADVSGHGVGACMVMSMIRTLIRSYAPYIRDPKEILCRINDTLYQDTPSNIYATLFYGIYQRETRRLVFACGGHNQGVLFHPGKKEIRTLKAGGMAAGILDTAAYKSLIQNYATTLEPGEIFMQYTDGITEAMNPEGEEYGMDRLLEAVKKSGAAEIQGVFQRLMKDVEKFTRNAVQSDDMTLMGIQVKGGLSA